MTATAAALSARFVIDGPASTPPSSLDTVEVGRAQRQPTDGDRRHGVCAGNIAPDDTPRPPIDSIQTLMTVWSIRRKIIGTAIIISYTCTPVSYTHLTLPTNREV